MKRFQNITGVVSLLFLALALLAAAQSFASEVYKTVDERGNAVFTDQSTPQSKPVDLQELNTLAPPAAKPPSVEYSNPKEFTTEYSVVIVSPEDQHLFPNRLLAFQVVAEATPKLQSGQQLRLLIDGSPHSTSQGSFTVESLGIGEHILQVEILTLDKEAIGRSEAITIFSRQPG